MEAEPFGSILSIVPRGFEAYARVFHPVERDRPLNTKTGQGVDARTGCADGDDTEVALETQRATWADAAASFATTMHAEAQYARLIRRDHGNCMEEIAPDGWRYGGTHEGCVDALSLSTVSVILGRHTNTPDAGVAAIWDGWGGLMSSAGVMRLVLQTGDDLADPTTDEAAAQRGSDGVLPVGEACAEPAPDEPEWGSGLLAPEIAAGPRFGLHADTGRSYLLFEAGANDFADAAWANHAPWVDDVMWAQSPSILWPEDHSWVLATEIDFDSTLVAGTAALVRDLMQTPGLEVLPIRTDADLSWDGDVINRAR